MKVMEMTNYASKGVGNAALATGVIGTSLGVLNAMGGLGALTGVVRGANANTNCINEDHCVNRYELNMVRENDRAIVEKDLVIAQKDSELALARAKENTREEIIQIYQQIKAEMNAQNDTNASQFAAINQQLGAQAVQNQANKDSFQILQERMDNCYNTLDCAIKRECETRKANDNLIVTYTNATFYPNRIAPLAVNTTAAVTAAQTYNPLPACDCNCNC